LAQGAEERELGTGRLVQGVAPSDRLRRWFGHDPKKWKEFRKRYFAELRIKAETWQPIMERARRADVTLVYGARDSEHNNAVALRDFLVAELKKKDP
jgi:uncharacterized protein YeaO (DUF488 family)